MASDPQPDVVDWNSLTTLVVVTDPFGMFEEISPAIKDYLGYEPDEVKGRLASDFIHPLDLGNTREEMRLARAQGRPRHFLCRYINKGGKPVELIWTGIWLDNRNRHVFVGRFPRRGERLPLLHRIDALDGFQVAKGMFAMSLVLAWWLGIGSSATREVREILAYFDGHAGYWAAGMTVYSLLCMHVFFFNNKVLEFSISLASTVVWIWTGAITLLSPSYVAAAAIYELGLGLASIYVLYLRGRLL